MSLNIMEKMRANYNRNPAPGASAVLMDVVRPSGAVLCFDSKCLLILARTPCHVGRLLAPGHSGAGEEVGGMGSVDFGSDSTTMNGNLIKQHTT